MAITIFLVLKQLLKIQSSGAVLGGEGVFSEPRGGGLGWGKWGVSTDLSPKYELVSIKIPQRRIVSCSISARAQRKHSVRNPDKAVHKINSSEWMNEYRWWGGRGVGKMPECSTKINAYILLLPASSMHIAQWDLKRNN